MTDSFKLYLILGMHRSGTSCLTGCLEECGLYTGDTVRFDDWKKKAASGHPNPKGNREHPVVFNFHEAILVREGYSAFNPPSEDLIFADVDQRMLLFILKRVTESFSVNFLTKDPRAIFMWDLWSQLNLPIQPVISFRNPLSVARSLQTRNGFSIEKGVALWELYNSGIIKLVQDYSVPVISYDRFGQDYLEQIRKLLAAFGLNSSQDVSFYNTDLNRSSSPDDDISSLPISVVDLYELLQIASTNVYKANEFNVQQEKYMKINDVDIRAVKPDDYPRKKFWQALATLLRETNEKELAAIASENSTLFKK